MTEDLTVDAGLYPVEAVMGAAYVFIDRCYVFLDRAGDTTLKVSLTARPGTGAEALRDIAGEFQNELLAQALRLQVARRHEKTREAVVARALFGAAPLVHAHAPETAPGDGQLGIEPRYLPAEDDDYLDDPLGIAVPWEEKYAGEKGEAGAEKADAGNDGAAGDGAGRSR